MKGKPLTLKSQVESSKFSPAGNTSNSILVSFFNDLWTLNTKSLSSLLSPL